MRKCYREKQHSPSIATAFSCLIPTPHTPLSTIAPVAKLVRYVGNGNWPISNNLCENAIRPFVVGRKGRLFSDTVGGAQASANLCSIVETCKANGVAPYNDLVWLFTKLPLAETVDDYATLPPWKLFS